MSNVVIIGGGHNGLAAAFYLAKAGRQPIVLERREQVGGGAITAEIHPGFQCPILSHNVLLHERVVREMQLRRHGVEFLSPAARVFAPAMQPIAIFDNPAQTAEALRRVNPKDAEAYATFRETFRRMAGVIAPVLASPPPHIDKPAPRDLWSLLKTARAFRALGPRDGHRLLRWMPMSVADLVSEWFELDALRAAVAAPGLSGTVLGPRSAGGVLVLALAEAHELLAGGIRRVRGGPGALTRAMANAAKGAGAVIRTSTAVERILVHEGRVTGVVAGGQEIPASLVLSAVDPKTTLLQLVGAEALGPTLAGRMRNYRTRGTVAKVNLALSALPAFEGAGRDEALLSGRIHIGPTLDYMERAFDHVKYGQVSADPWLEVTIPSILDPGLAPAKAHVASVYVHYAPRDLRTGPWSTWREAVLASALRVLERHAPRFWSLVLASQVITPDELEDDYGLAGGHTFHGELAIDQLFTMRPMIGYGRYESPIRGLYLCSAGTHPGGFLTGVSGRLGAREALANRDKS